jgi:hypothetical protein
VRQCELPLFPTFLAHMYVCMYVYVCIADIQAGMRTGRLKMYPLSRDVFDIPYYNNLMLHNVSFWEFMGGKHVLIFQV